MSAHEKLLQEQRDMLVVEANQHLAAIRFLMDELVVWKDRAETLTTERDMLHTALKRVNDEMNE